MTNQENKKEEMRDSIRVKVHFPLPYSLITEEEFLSIKDTFCLHRTSDREGLPAPLQTASDQGFMERNMEETLGPGFVQMWKLLDQKLDLIYSALTGKKQEGWEHEAVCVEVGGLSIKFLSADTALHPGCRLKLRISPPTFPPFSMVVLGTAQRVKKKEDDQGRPCSEIAAVFDVINKDEQEGLYAYLFKRQREIIRSGND